MIHLSNEFQSLLTSTVEAAEPGTFKEGSAGGLQTRGALSWEGIEVGMDVEKAPANFKGSAISVTALQWDLMALQV